MSRKCLRTLPTVPVLRNSVHPYHRFLPIPHPLRSLVSAIGPHRRRTRGRIPSSLYPQSSPAQSRTRLYFPKKWKLARRSSSSTNSSIQAIAHGRLLVILLLWSRISRLSVVIRPLPHPHSRLSRWGSNRPLASNPISHSADSHRLLGRDPSFPRAWGIRRARATVGA